jgi:hypothetical protein
MSSKKTKRQINEIMEALEYMDGDYIDAFHSSVMSMRAEGELDNEPVQVVVKRPKKTNPAKVEKPKAKRTVKVAEDAPKFSDMSEREQRAYIRALNVKPNDAGENLARFLKKVAKMASEHTEKQLLRMGKEAEIKFVFGKGRQDPYVKKEKMAAQILIQ